LRPFMRIELYALALHITRQQGRNVPRGFALLA
jgi:hypothetical protein